jgi:hypothetical protein
MKKHTVASAETYARPVAHRWRKIAPVKDMGKGSAMKLYHVTATITVAVSLAFALPSWAQVVIYDDQPTANSEYRGQTEADFLNRWNQRHERRGWDHFGPDDAIHLLERRGYRVKNVTDVGERFLVRAWRDGDDLLVSVSRSGEIMGVVHEGY